MGSSPFGSGGVALVLGAGGPTGHAFHAGVLCALLERHGWDARDADLIIGTSAGAQVGAMLRAGMSPWDLKARITGEPLSRDGRRIADCFCRPDPVPSWKFGRPAGAPYLRSVLRRPWAVRPGRMAAALMAEGKTDLAPMAEGMRRLFAEDWPVASLWLPVVDLESGQRRVFGRAGAPRTDIGTAVAASCAVPGVFAPVRLNGYRFVDGGIASANHADLLVGEPFARVIVCSPLSRFAPLRWLLAAELRRLRQQTEVVLLEPDPSCVSAIGWSPMDTTRGPAVARAAFAYGSNGAVKVLDPVADLEPPQPAPGPSLVTP